MRIPRRGITLLLAGQLWGLVSCGHTDERQGAQDGDHVTPSDHAEAQHWLLPIPARLQWENEHGFCGETSIQSIGLYYGAWVSQQIIRGVSGGETLLGLNAATALTALHFQFEEWLGEPHGAAQFRPFMLWMKTHLAQATPLIVGTYLSDMQDPDYDHIVPVTGMHAHTPDPSIFDPLDVLVFNSNFSTTPTTAGFGEIGVTRADCNAQQATKGCIPMQHDHGIAVGGLADRDGTARPLRLTVDVAGEPNVTLGDVGQPMRATAIVSGLTPGKTYALLRYNDYLKVPVSGSAHDWLTTAAFDSRLDFTAVSREWSYADPVAFASDSAVYYRCVELGSKR